MAAEGPEWGPGTGHGAGGRLKPKFALYIVFSKLMHFGERNVRIYMIFPTVLLIVFFF